MNSTQLIRLTGRWPTVVIWIYIATMAILALSSLHDVRHIWPTIVGLTVFAVIGIVFSGDRGDPMSLRSALLVVIAWPLIAVMISWELTSVGGHAQWYFGAGTVSLFYVSLRGRLTLAWVGFALLAGVIAVWGITTAEIGLVTALGLIGKQLPIMIAGTLFAVGVRRTVASIDRLTRAASLRASTEAAHLAMTAERNERLAGLDAVATPLLTRLVDGTELTGADRMQFTVAEAELRDSLRARTLSVPSVVTAARAARLRGVDVVLLDDSDPARVSSTDLAAVIARVAAALTESTDGRIVARLLPPGRTDVATLLVDGSGSARHEVVHASGNGEGPATS